MHATPLNTTEDETATVKEKRYRVLPNEQVDLVLLS